MSKKPERNLVAALDIGTSKIVAIIGIINSDKKLDVIGVGTQVSRGLKKGVVVNIDSTVQAIEQALEEAESMAGTQVRSVLTGIAGSHIRSFNSHGVVAVRDQEITAKDVERVMEAAKAVAIPADQKILHILPQEFIVDYQGGIREPIGMTGIRLEVNVHMVTGSLNAAQNIVKCIRKCDLDVEEMILQQLASAEAVLTEDEKQLGVCVLDIGGGTTDIAVFHEGTIKHTAVIPVAGDQVTNDIAVALRIPTQNAENIKIQYACALSELSDPEKVVEVPSIGEKSNKRFSQVALSEVVEPRFEELFNLVQAELNRSGLADQLGAGIVITGGSARLQGLIELAEEIFHLPVRLGVPRDVSGLTEVVRNPGYSTAVGLLQVGVQGRDALQGLELSVDPGFNGIVGRVKHWVQRHF